MEDDSNSRKIPEDLIKTLVEYRVRIFENLAGDALTLISIQLFVVSISFSLYLGFSSNGSDYEQQFANSINNSNFFALAIISYIVAVPVAVIIHHQARKKASRTPNKLIERQIGTRDTVYSQSKDMLMNYLGEKYPKKLQRATSRHGLLYKIKSKKSKLEDNYNLPLRTDLESGLDHPASDERRLRMLLSVSILLTFSSVAFSIMALIQPVFSQIEILVVVLLFTSLFCIIFLYFNSIFLSLLTNFVIRSVRDTLFFVSRVIHALVSLISRIS